MRPSSRPLFLLQAGRDYHQALGPGDHKSALVEGREGLKAPERKW